MMTRATKAVALVEKRREEMEFRGIERNLLMGIVDQFDGIGEERIQRKTLVL